jgi:hypothetical protein
MHQTLECRTKIHVRSSSKPLEALANQHVRCACPFGLVVGAILMHRGISDEANNCNMPFDICLPQARVLLALSVNA